MSAWPCYLVDESMLKDIQQRLTRQTITMECTVPLQLTRGKNGYYREWRVTWQATGGQGTRLIVWDNKPLESSETLLTFGPELPKHQGRLTAHFCQALIAAGGRVLVAAA